MLVLHLCFIKGLLVVHPRKLWFQILDDALWPPDKHCIDLCFHKRQNYLKGARVRTPNVNEPIHFSLSNFQNVETAEKSPFVTPPPRTPYIRNQCNFLSKLVIVALSHYEWKSMPVAMGSCCSVEQWNDSGERVALGPALRGPVNHSSLWERYGTGSGDSQSVATKSEPVVTDELTYSTLLRDLVLISSSLSVYRSARFHFHRAQCLRCLTGLSSSNSERRWDSTGHGKYPFLSSNHHVMIMYTLTLVSYSSGC